MGELTFEDFLRRLGPGLSPENVLPRLLEQLLEQSELALAEAFLMCAVPHRFDAALRDGSEDEATKLINRMATLSFVYQSQDGRYYYHENVRAYFLPKTQQDQARFREWSARAAEFYEGKLGEKAWLAKWTGPRQAGLTPAEDELYGEAIYHLLAVDDETAFPLFEQAFQDAEFAWRLAVCQALVAGGREQAAALTGDRPLWLRYYEGRLLQAAQRWAEAVAVYREMLADSVGKKLRACTLHELGMALHSLGQWEAAIVAYQEALPLRRELGDRRNEAATLNNIGSVYDSQGRWGEALVQYEASLKIMRDLGDRTGEANTLGNIGNVYSSQGRWEEALTQYEASLKIARELGDRAVETNTLGNIGNVYHAQGRLDDAIEYYQQDLAIERELGDADGETSSLVNIAESLKKKGQWPDALRHYEESLKIARAMGNRVKEARRLGGMADVCKATGEWEKAQQYYQQAIDILRGTEDKEQLADWLAELSELYRDQHRWQEALSCEEEALDIWRELAERGS